MELPSDRAIRAAHERPEAGGVSESSYSTSVAELRSTSQAALALLSRALVPDPRSGDTASGQFQDKAAARG